MNANFDEKQAFENLHDILNHIYSFANHYYAEMQNAQGLCEEKSAEIEKLQDQLADERDKAEMRLKRTVQAKDAEISGLKNELSKQLEMFNTELQKSREANGKLTNLLNNVYTDLKTKKESLDEREKDLKKRVEQLQKDSDTLATASANFEEERSNFYALQEMQAENHSDSERINNFEEELRTLTQQKNELEEDLKTTKRALEKVKAKNERLQRIIDNADAERKPFNDTLPDPNDFNDDVNVAPISNMNFGNNSADNDADFDGGVSENINKDTTEKADDVNDVNDVKGTPKNEKEWWKNGE